MQLTYRYGIVCFTCISISSLVGESALCILTVFEEMQITVYCDNICNGIKAKNAVLLFFVTPITSATPVTPATPITLAAPTSTESNMGHRHVYSIRLVTNCHRSTYMYPRTPVAYRWGWGVQIPPPRNSEGPPKSCQTQPDCENS